MSYNSSNVVSIFKYLHKCFTLPSTNYHVIAYALVNVPFVVPLLLYIFYYGVQQWRIRAKISHTDFFTYNFVVIQISASVGSVFLIINMFLKIELIIKMCIYMFFIHTSANIVFQIFTCLERYMAVVHPVTYLGLKSQTWALIRNLSCAFVWFQCTIQGICLTTIDSMAGYFAYTFLCLLFSLVIILFCNICVLRALLRPGPGDNAKGDTSKQKALYTITTITGTLLFKFGGDMFCVLVCLLTIDILNDDDMDRSCALYFSVIWFTLPSTLVLPLLFLHRNGKLLCFSKNKQANK